VKTEASLVPEKSSFVGSLPYYGGRIVTLPWLHLGIRPAVVSTDEGGKAYGVGMTVQLTVK
jgi:hypothetical protein